MAKKTLADLAEALKTLARAYPEVHEDFPWGESAFKVAGKKVFLFMHGNEAVLTLSLKLPESRHAALMLPFTSPTGYGLGKSGWVTARLEAGAGAPMELLTAWVDESYRAVAPAKLVKAMDAARADRGVAGGAGGTGGTGHTAKRDSTGRARTAKSRPRAK